MQRVLVIGAGIAGLACAAVLRGAGHAVTVVDKARGPGGRAATRRGPGGRAATRRGPGGRAATRDAPVGGFDHGVQYFTARDPDFRREVERWMAAGAAALWEGRIGSLESGHAALQDDGPPRYVGTPRMSVLGRHLAAGLEVILGRRATRLCRGPEGFRLACEDGGSLGPFDAAVVATPSPQAVPLLDASPPLAARAAAAAMDPCWAVMLSFGAPVPLALDGAFVVHPALAWAARDTSKPGRPPGERFVLQATPAFSDARRDAPREDVEEELLAAFGEALAAPLPRVLHRDAQRWLHARTTRALGVAFLLDEAQGLGVCGDYCLGDRVEAAWRSGRALGERLAARAAGR